MTHDIVRHGTGHFQCLVCYQTWKSRSKAPCPGVRVYPRYDYAPLLTQTQLGYMGYQNTKKVLPPRSGCYYTSGGSGEGGYVFLYDPAQAVKNKPSARQRFVTSVVTEVHWPLQALPLIRDLSDFLGDRELHKDRAYEDLINEIANIAAHLSAFTHTEIQQLVSQTITLDISPSLIRRAYPSFEANPSEQIALASRIAAIYKKLNV